MSVVQGQCNQRGGNSRTLYGSSLSISSLSQCVSDYNTSNSCEHVPSLFSESNSFSSSDSNCIIDVMNKSSDITKVFSTHDNVGVNRRNTTNISNASNAKTVVTVVKSTVTVQSDSAKSDIYCDIY